MADGAHAYSFPGLTGGTIDLKSFAGRPVLVLNTASACGYTPQYQGLQALHERYGGRGLAVLGVPSNDFGAQEPGDAGQIQAFCTSRFAVSFPLTAKQRVIGPDAHPFYRWIVTSLGEGAAPRWNFHKYLVGPDGGLVESWPSKVAPEDAQIVQAFTPHLK